MVTWVEPPRVSSDGPLAGLAFTVKDALAVAGVRCTAGSLLLRDDVAGETAPVVSALQDAGAVVVGKTNCSEFALAPIPLNALFGVTTNPRDPALSAGGSSCGCAAAVASGIVPFSVGSDYGGSVRYPAACTGIVGFRPAAGTVDPGGQVPAAPPGSPRARFSLPGLLCRDVDVLELLLRVLVPGELGATPDAPPPHATLPPALIDELDAAFTAVRATDTLDDLRTLTQGREDQLTDSMRALLARTVAPAASAAEAEEALTALRERVDTMMRDIPVLLAPVTTLPAPPLHETDDSPEHVDSLFRALAPCRAVTALGLHALSVPTHGGGSVQVIAARGHLADALAVAAGTRARV